MGTVKSKNAYITIATKFLILLINFLLVAFSTQTWGSEGRGELALIIANVSIITIFSNIFCGSTIAYHVPKVQHDFLFLVSFAGAFLVSLSGAAICSLFIGFKYFSLLFVLAFLLSLVATISTYWLGRKNINKYNLLTLLSPLSILIILVVLYFIFGKNSLSTYFQAYLIGTGIVLVVGITGLVLTETFKKPEFSFAGIKSILNYGINNEFNNLIQFISYRLSYYFIANLLGLARLGVFSIAISISEGVWVVSRSLSAIHFSNVINSNYQHKIRHETMILATQSFMISLLLLCISVLIPDSVYQFTFGNEFAEIKQFIMYMIPGIIAIAASNLYEQYFSGIGKLKVLRTRSAIGLGATIILLPLLIKKYQLTGVCITMNISYILSTFYLWLKFQKEGKSVDGEIIH